MLTNANTPDDIVRRCLLLVLLLLATPAFADAQRIPYNQRVRFSAPPTPIDSATIELRVIDAASGRPVQSVVCLNAPRIANFVTDSLGVLRIGDLPRTNTFVRVLAPGYHDTELIFYPGKRGRSFVTVRVEPSASASRHPACDTNTRGPT